MCSILYYQKPTFCCCPWKIGEAGGCACWPVPPPSWMSHRSMMWSDEDWTFGRAMPHFMMSSAVGT